MNNIQSNTNVDSSNIARSKIFTIEILRFIAVFLIINSHSDIMFPKYSFVATGGAFGDALFLFISGFTLYLSLQKNKSITFFDYYKKRILRIYPSVFVCYIFCSLLAHHFSHSIVTLLGGQFVIAIMVYYVLLYFIIKYCFQYVKQIIIAVLLLFLVLYFCSNPENINLYSYLLYYRWIPYFGCMLLGTYMAHSNASIENFNKKNFILCFISIVLFYVLLNIGLHFQKFQFVQALSIFPLLGTMYYGYKSANIDLFNKLSAVPFWNKAITVISGVCLESYLIQFSLITDKLNFLFPLNLVIITAEIIIVSVLLKKLVQFMVNRINLILR